MRRDAKASSAGSNSSQASGLGRFFRGALAARGASSDEGGSGAPSGRRRLALLVLSFTAFLAIPASQASAEEVKVTLSGVGTGTVVSSPPGIECSNTPGSEKLSVDDCSEDFGVFTAGKLTAIPDDPSVFYRWIGTFPPPFFPGDVASTCNSGGANPCAFKTFVFAQATADAKFGPLPNPPVASTGGASEINSYQMNLEGTVTPEGAPVTSCRFEYGQTTAYGESEPCAETELGEGTAPVAVSAKTAAIAPGRTYHYRLVVSNPGGTSKGENATFASTPIQDNCLNAAIRAEQGAPAMRLPQCMALEMVSPPKKYNQYARFPRLSATGDRIQFESVAALDTPRQGFLEDSYLSSRTASGWVTKATAPPVQYSVGYSVTGRPCAYTPDLSHWATFFSTESQTKVGIVTAFRGSVGGPFSPLSPTMTPTSVPDGSDSLTFAVNGGQCQGSSIDARHFFFSLGNLGYLSGDPEPSLYTPSGQGNVYEAHRDENGTPSIRLLTRDGDGHVFGGGCGASIGSPNFGRYYTRKGAISPDASRIYFSTSPGETGSGKCDEDTNHIRIMKRIETPAGPWISELIHSECTRVAPPCDTTDGDDLFQGASQDGTKVFFRTTRQLVNGDRDTGSFCGLEELVQPGCDLYLYDSTRPVGKRLTLVSEGDSTDLTPGENAEVRGATEVAGDGSRVYFVANDRLTSAPSPAGQSAVAGQPNLYLYQRDGAYPDGRLAFIGTLADTIPDRPLWRYGSNGPSAAAVPALGSEVEGQETGGDGHVLVFVTTSSLTSDDTDGGFEDTYRYDSDAEQLQRVSRAAPGGSDNGSFLVTSTEWDKRPSDASGPQDFSFERKVSEDGRSIVFITGEALDPTDKNDKENAYLWRDGEVIALPYAFYPTISMSGEEIAFSSTAKLLPQDGDGVDDVYVARANGGFPTPPPVVGCQGEACQEPFRAQPPPPSSASDSFSGSGNAKEAPKKKHKKKHKKAKRKHKSRAGHKQGGQK